MLNLRSEDIEELIAKSHISERKRKALSLHSPNYKGPRVLLNCIQPNSYIRPHKHEIDSGEIWIYIQGELRLVTFNEAGELENSLILGNKNKLIEIPPRRFHTAFAVQEDSIVYEISQGPYDSKTYKTFASWAPPEQDILRSKIYLDNLILNSLI